MSVHIEKTDGIYYLFENNKKISKIEHDKGIAFVFRGTNKEPLPEMARPLYDVARGYSK